MSGAEYVPDVTNPAHSGDRPTVFFDRPRERPILPVQAIIDRLSQPGALAPERKVGMIDFSDEKLEEIRLIDSLNERCVQRSYLEYLEAADVLQAIGGDQLPRQSRRDTPALQMSQINGSRTVCTVSVAF
jgi:hypothetical protein